jgi:hypothetical protein
MPKEVSYLMRHRIAEPLEGFVVLMPAAPYRSVYRDCAPLYFGPHLNNGICRFSARYAFVFRVRKLMRTCHNGRCTACRYAMPILLSELQGERHGICSWVRPAVVSAGRRGQQKCRREDDRKEEASHALHAEADGRPALPPKRVILGEAAGEPGVRRDSPLRALLPMKTYALARAWADYAATYTHHRSSGPLR